MGLFRGMILVREQVKNVQVFFPRKKVQSLLNSDSTIVLIRISNIEYRTNLNVVAPQYVQTVTAQKTTKMHLFSRSGK